MTETGVSGAPYCPAAGDSRPSSSFDITTSSFDGTGDGAKLERLAGDALCVPAKELVSVVVSAPPPPLQLLLVALPLLLVPTAPV